MDRQRCRGREEEGVPAVRRRVRRCWPPGESAVERWSRLRAADHEAERRGRDLDEREVALAERLVSALEDRFDPAAFKDEHRARVMALIESKARGEKLELPRVKKKKPARSLLKALEASLRRAKEPRVA